MISVIYIWISVMIIIFHTEAHRSSQRGYQPCQALHQSPPGFPLAHRKLPDETNMFVKACFNLVIPFLPQGTPQGRERQHILLPRQVDRARHYSPWHNCQSFAKCNNSKGRQRRKPSDYNLFNCRRCLLLFQPIKDCHMRWRSWNEGSPIKKFFWCCLKGYWNGMECYEKLPS